MNESFLETCAIPIVEILGVPYMSQVFLVFIVIVTLAIILVVHKKYKLRTWQCSALVVPAMFVLWFITYQSCV